MAKVAIVGAGLTGLCLSILLRKEGHNVVVVEKNAWPGGIYASKQKKQYFFNSGLEFYFPHTWLLNFFKQINEDIDKFLDFELVDIKYKTYLTGLNSTISADNNKKIALGQAQNPNSLDIIKLTNNFKYFRETIGYLEGEGKKLDYSGIDSLLEHINKHLEKFTELYEIGQDTIELEKFLLKNDFRYGLDAYLRKYFKNPNTLEFFNSFALFFGNQAKDSPAYFIFLLVDMIQKPVYKPKDGFTELAEKLYFLALSNGVKFWLEQEIETIVIDEKSRAKALKIKNSSSLQAQLDLNAENKFEIPDQDNVLSFDYLVHTGDYESFERDLLIQDRYRNYSNKFFDDLKYSPSYSTFLIGLKKEFSNLASHNFISGSLISDDTKSPKIEFDTPIYFTTMKADEDGSSTLKVLSFQNSSALCTKDDQDRLLLSCIQKISKATRIDFSQYIDTYISVDPEDLKKDFLFAKKSPYGIKHNLEIPTSFLLNGNGKVKNIVYATNSNYPGGNGLFSIIRAKTVFRDLKSYISKSV